MQVRRADVEIPVAGKQMRALVAQPATEGQYPGIVYFSDIFQLSGWMERMCTRLAGYGFVVAAHEIFHRLEPTGTVLPQNDEGRARGTKNQLATPVAHFDEDCRAVLDYLKQQPQVVAEHLGAGGFCIGGHLAFRAALQPEVKATSCFYPTWLHNGKLGAGEHAGSLERAAAIRGELLVHFGALDPLIPAEGRTAVETALQQAGVKYESLLYPADHGFMRDDRAAYDPACADRAFAAALGLFQRVFTAQ